MKPNGVATILLMIPVLTVPALAIFGIPQFAPVVASPLEEGRGIDRESRVGNSTRPSQDGLFDDLEGMEDEADDSPRSSSLKKRRPARSRSFDEDDSREPPRRRSTAEAQPSWSDDLEAESAWPSGSTRRPSVRESSDPSELPQELSDRSRLERSEAAHPMRYERRSQRSAAAADTSGRKSLAATSAGIVQAGFVDEPPPQDSERIPGEREQLRNSGETSRAKSESARGRREIATESLTWAAAVEKLNEYDIRNFRLEPGARSGQFVFICTYAAPDSPTVSYRFEAGADEPLKAVEKVLEQIVEWRQKQ